jgi:hypothetical protein
MCVQASFNNQVREGFQCRRDPGVTLVQLAIVSTDLPAGMPPAGALPRDVQLAGDLGRQFGGAFPAGLAGGAVR